MTPLHILCYHCEAECTDVNWCYGCHEIVCSECDQAESMGSHAPDDHLTRAGARVKELLGLLESIAILASPAGAACDSA